MTQPRRQVLEVLDELQEPVSPYNIQEILLKKGKRLNHVTIYRVLSLFCQLNLAHKLSSVGGFVRCKLSDKEGCHRFMICRQCGVCHEFADEALCEKEKEIARNLGFCTELHLAESVGLCRNCKQDKP
jgi:Fur family zinc uptake transcriptional regulator